MPDEIKEARVLTGQGFITKSEFFKLKNESLIGTISHGAKERDEKERQKLINSEIAKGIYNFSDLSVNGDEVIAVGNFGGFIFDLNGHLKKRILFEPIERKIQVGPFKSTSYQSDTDNLSVVHLTKDKIGFLSYGSVQGVRVFDEIGNQIWTIGKVDIDVNFLKDEKDPETDKHVLEAAVGDLDNDGISEYIVATKNDGLRTYGADGNLKWFQPKEFPSNDLAVIDLDGDGKNELTEISENVRDGDGKLLYEIKTKNSGCPVFISDEAGKTHIRSAGLMYDGKLHYWDEDGTVIFEPDLPLSSIPIKPVKVEVPGYPESGYTNDSEDASCRKAVLVKLKKDEPEFLAVLASYIGLPRSNLYIFDSKGTLVFHELLPEEAETIAVMPNDNGTDEFVVGGKETIWRYSRNEDAVDR